MSYIGNQPTPQSLESRQEFTATASQTTFATSGYTVGYVDCYLNGVKLSTSDFTATNGSDVVLGSGAAAGDVLAVVMKNDHSDLVALPITDSAGNNVLSESGGVVTLTADAAIIEGSSSGDLVRITQTGSGNALVVEDSTNPDSTPFVVNSSGNLMLGGAANSWSTLQAVQIDRASISGYVGNSYLSHNFYDSSGGSKYIASGGACQIRLADHTIIFNRASSGSADATLSFSESMRIDSSGNLLVGTTSNEGVNGISFNPTTAPGIIINKSFSGTANAIRFWHNSTQVGYITYSNTTVSYSSASDYRLKENITQITDGITRVKQLNPSRFNFIAAPDKTVDGFLAHEAAEIVPEAVTGTKDAVDDEGNPEYQGVDYGRITPLLTAALQEAIAKIEMLETRIAVLEAK